MPSVIALDAMGSDRAPRPEIEGAIQAARHLGARVVLVGSEPIIKTELRRYRWTSQLPIEIVHASEVITMEDKAAQAVRSKRQSSMHVGLRLVREGRAAGFVTAGNTGAAMAAAKMILGALPGVDRPALAAVFPTAIRTGAMLLDVGANVDCDAHNLEQFAVMGEVYFRSIFSTRRPRVGLLSIGEEETKGNQLTREAFQLLKQLPLNFVGNVEGRDLYNGEVDVIVSDGFVGNVALKTSEGVVNLVRAALKEALRETITRQVGYLLSRSAFTDGSRRCRAAVAAAMCMAAGNVSFEDCDMFTSSFGWMGFLLPITPPAISIARFEITSLTFMFVCVPLPVCQMRSGK